MARPGTRAALRAASLLAVGGLLAVAVRAAWKLRRSAQLMKASEPLQAEPAQPGASLLVVGDSTAVGTGASSARTSVAGLIAANHPGLRVVKLARNGARYRDFVQQLRTAPGPFDVVLVLGGGNDVFRLTGTARLREDVRQALAQARALAPKVIVMPPGNVGNAPFFLRPLSWLMTRRAQALHAVVAEAAKAQGARYVRLYQPREEDPFAQRPREMHAADGLHPSDEGYALWLREFDRQAGAVFTR